MVRPVTLCVSKVSVTENKYTSILMGTVQYAIANGVLDAVRAGYIPKEKANDLGIICSVWLSPGVIQAESVDHKALFEIQRKGMTEANRKAMTNEPSIDWLLENLQLASPGSTLRRPTVVFEIMGKIAMMVAQMTSATCVSRTRMMMRGATAPTGVTCSITA